MCFIQQKYYRVDYGYFKLPALLGWREYVQKVRKTGKNKYNQRLTKQKINENVKTTSTYNPKTIQQL